MAIHLHLHLLVLVFVLLVPTPQPARGNVSRLSPMDDLSPQIVTIDFKVVTDDYETLLVKLVWCKLRMTAKINGPDEALRTLSLVLWPNDYKFSFDAITADDDGKPLADDSSTTCNGTSCN